MPKVTLIASGTRGDAQPAILLGKRLLAAGHDVTIVASRSFRAWIEDEGLHAAPTTVDIHQVMLSEKGHEWVERGHNPLVQTNLMKDLINDFGPALVADSWAACREADVIISSFTSDAYALSFAEKTGAFHASMPLQPSLIATSYGPALPNAPLPGRNSRVNYWFSRLMIETFPWQLFGTIVNDFRQRVLTLPPTDNAANVAGRRSLLTLHAYSEHVSPPAPDWPDSYHLTGYFFPDEANWQPPASLSEFLAAGAPPIVFGFGSMTGRDPVRLSRLLVEAAQLSGRRALILSGWAGIGQLDLPDSITTLSAAPHQWLLPRAAAFVHHGGAGTTAAGLRAGIPTVIVPHFSDQPFWASRLARLGVTPRPIPRHKLTASRLATAIDTALGDQEMKVRLRALSGSIGAEDGLARALALLSARLQ